MSLELLRKIARVPPVMEAFLSYLHTAFLIFIVIMFFNLMIFIHELGHFFAARWRGLYVDRFQIWFGKAIWKKTINGVQWGLGWIPAGGFVSLPQMAPMEAIEGDVDLPADLKEVSALDKIIVAAAGPLSSLGLAFIFAFIVWGVGKPTPTYEGTTIGYVLADKPGAKAGLQAGDKILSIDGHPVTQWLSADMDGVRELMMLGEGKTIKFLVQRPGQEAPLALESSFDLPEKKWWQRKAMRQVGLLPATDLVVDAVVEHSPAFKAGLSKGDKIIAVNGVLVYSALAVSDVMKKGEPCTLTVRKSGQQDTVSIKVRPEVPANWAGQTGATTVLGLTWATIESPIEITHPTPWAQVKQSLNWMSVTMQKLFAKDSSVGVEHLSGPVGIGNMIYRMVSQEYGWMMILWFAVFLNVNLAVLNALPLPVVDGGHVVLNTLELIFRRPISGKVLEYIQTGFVFLLMGFAVFVTFKDVGDLFGGTTKTPEEQLPAPVFKAS